MRASFFVLLMLAPLLGGCESLPAWMGGPKKSIAKIPGERLPVLASAVNLAPDSALAALPANVPPEELEPAWLNHTGNAQGNPALGRELAGEHSARAGEGNRFEYRLVTPPAFGGNAVYAMDGEGYISAHAIGNIEQVLWVSNGVVNEEEEAVLGGGVVFEQGRVFATSGKGLVVGLDAATGKEIWRKMLGIPIRSAPRAEGNRVFVVTVDSELYALDAATGAVLWTHRGVNEGKGFLIEASPLPLGEAVIVPYSSGEVHALRVDDGSEIWSDVVMGPQRQSALSVFTGIGGEPVMADGILYVAGSAGQFAAFQLTTGRRLWEQPISSVNTPWVAGDMVYVLSSDASVIAMNRMDGRIRWVSQLELFANPETKQGRRSWSGPVMAGGRLLVVGAHGEMAEITPQDGAVSMREIPDGIYTAPVVGLSAAFMMSDSATLHALY